MAYSYIEYIGDGTTKTFNIPFTYLKQADVKVYVGGVNTAFTFTSSNVVSLAVAPPSGEVVRVARYTDASQRIVDFQDGSVLSEADLDSALDQVFNISQEALDRANEGLFTDPADGQLDAKSLRLKNLTDPSSPQDAATKNYVDTSLTSGVAQAALYAEQAAASAVEAAQAVAHFTVSTEDPSGGVDGDIWFKVTI